MNALFASSCEITSIFKSETILSEKIEKIQTAIIDKNKTEKVAVPMIVLFSRLSSLLAINRITLLVNPASKILA